jgi:hypothetical protein
VKSALARALGLSPLMPAIFPTISDHSSLVPWVGLVTPRAARVTVTFFGRDFSATVIPVPLGSGQDTGIFIAWVKLPAGVSNLAAATSPARSPTTGPGASSPGPAHDRDDHGGRARAAHHRPLIPAIPSQRSRS